MQRRSVGHESFVPDPGAIRRVRVYVPFGTGRARSLTLRGTRPTA
jgi:hypothetical protein